MNSKRVFLFTPQAEPPCPAGMTVAEAIALAKNHAEQLETNSVDLELFPIRIGGRIFDYKLFYADIVKVDADEIND